MVHAASLFLTVAFATPRRRSCPEHTEDPFARPHPTSSTAFQAVRAGEPAQAEGSRSRLEGMAGTPPSRVWSQLPEPPGSSAGAVRRRCRSASIRPPTGSSSAGTEATGSPSVERVQMRPPPQQLKRGKTQRREGGPEEIWGSEMSRCWSGDPLPGNWTTPRPLSWTGFLFSGRATVAGRLRLAETAAAAVPSFLTARMPAHPGTSVATPDRLYGPTIDRVCRLDRVETGVTLFWELTSSVVESLETAAPDGRTAGWATSDRVDVAAAGASQRDRRVSRAL